MNKVTFHKKVSVIVMLSLLGAVPKMVEADCQVEEGKVTTRKDSLNIRKLPNTNSEVIATVSKGTKLEVLLEEGNWYIVRLRDGTVGYANSEYITKFEASNPPKTLEVDCPATRENNCGENFSKFEGTFSRFPCLKDISTPNGFVIQSAPSKNVDFLVKMEQKEVLSRIVGFLQNEEGKFYVTEYSCQSYSQEKPFFWVYPR